MRNISPFYTMEMMRFAGELEQAGRNVLHLEVGQSIFSTPQIVLNEAKQVLKAPPLNYCSALGLYELRAAIALHYEKKYGLKIKPDSVVVTPGTSFALYLALLINFKPASKIAVASPSYPCYRNVIQTLGHTLVEIPTKRENNYLLTSELLAEYERERLDGILIASPNNPTGSMYSPDELKKLALYCQSKGIKVLSDELYHGITYESSAETMLRFNTNAIIINGFSKYFVMTGWRVGWIIVPEEDIYKYEHFLQNIILCTSVLTQAAAVKAFSAYEELDSHVKSYKINRNILHDSLSGLLPFPLYKPQGAFYLYIDLQHLKIDSLELCKKLLYEKNVAVAPGLDFSSHSTSAIRLSFCQKQEIIEKASEKIAAFLKTQ